MRLIDLHHVAIHVKDVDATDRFYIDALGMHKAPRPDVGVPGSWLAMGSTMIHTMGGRPASAQSDARDAVDHLALRAQGFDAYKRRFQELGIEFKEMGIEAAGLWQLFVRDPNGVRIELNFDVRDEPEGSVGPADAVSRPV